MSFDSATSGGHSALRSTRQQNLAAILSLLHHVGPQSRARLTVATGRNRSTVAALVGELVARGLAIESTADPTNQVGRPSPTVTADARNIAFAVNPEVDAVTVGVVALGGRVLDRRRYEFRRTPTSGEVVDVTARAIGELRTGLPGQTVVHGIGVAVPGLVRADDGLVRWAPHLEWYDEPLARDLETATGVPVVAGNDASVGAVAERLFGVGRGVADLVYLNGGASGIGGGVIAGGRLLEGASGYAGEFGHIRVDSSGEQTDAGSLESRVARADLADALGLGSVDADELEQALLASDDPRVAQLVRRQLEFLSTSLRNIVNVLNPQMIVLGGFLGSLFLADPEYLTERVGAQSIPLSFESVAIRRASLGSQLLMIGAAELVFTRMLADLAEGRVPTPPDAVPSIEKENGPE